MATDWDSIIQAAAQQQQANVRQANAQQLGPGAGGWDSIVRNAATQTQANQNVANNVFSNPGQLAPGQNFTPGNPFGGLIGPPGSSEAMQLFQQTHPGLGAAGRDAAEAAQSAQAAKYGAQYGGIGMAGYKDQNQARAQQQALIRQLQDQAAGLGPSLAQGQLQQANEAAMRQAMALGYSQRGAGAAGALKSIREQQAGIGQQNAADSAMLRMKEQLEARQMLGGLLGGMRGQDQSNMQFGLGNQSQLAMQQAAFEEARRQANEQNRIAWEQARQGQAGIDYQNGFLNNFGKILGGVGQLGGMLGAGLEGYGQIRKAG